MLLQELHTSSWPPPWSSVQSSWLQIQRSGFDSRRYQMFWEVVGLERGPLSLVSTIEELFGRKSSGSGLESRKYGFKDPSRWPRDTFYPQKFALTSPTSGGRSVGIVRSGTQGTKISFFFFFSFSTHRQVSMSSNTYVAISSTRPKITKCRPNHSVQKSLPQAHSRLSGQDIFRKLEVYIWTLF
jgi:hypothetical protein